jgi:hypothetical protein
VVSAENEEEQSFLSDGCKTYTDLEEAYSKVKDPELARRLKKLSRNYRKPPKDDKQLDIFAPPPLTDIATKDDISLMDIAVFGLGRKPLFKGFLIENPKPCPYLLKQFFNPRAGF